MTDTTSSQWDNLLHNLGAWRGSFARLSAQGDLVENVPSLVTLEGFDNNRAVRQTVQRFTPTGELLQNRVLEYRSLNRSVLFFDNGAFSQGSLQFGPFAEFGAELGFIHGDRRLRLVQLFDSNSHLANLTLIHESRQSDDATHQKNHHQTNQNACQKPDEVAGLLNTPLTVEQLQGTWQGEAITLYPDWRTPTRSTTALSIQREGDRLYQVLSFGNLKISSSATIEHRSAGHSVLKFEQGNFPIQVLLLPGGASCNTPLTIPRGQPFFLEAGWLIGTTRQRMIRRYDAQGGWESLTLVTERLVG